MNAAKGIEVTAEVTNVETAIEATNEEYGCFPLYEVELSIGDQVFNLDGSLICGWVAPGSSQDLDGGGLESWGDSQPGFWSCCQDENIKLRSHDQEEPDKEIYIVGLSNSIKITPDMVPAWKEAQEALEKANGEEYNQSEFDQAYDACDKIRDELLEKIEAALEDISPVVPEPSAKDVFESCDTDVVIVAGETVVAFDSYWCGCGPVIAWKEDGSYNFDYYPKQGYFVDKMLESCGLNDLVNNFLESQEDQD